MTALACQYSEENTKHRKVAIEASIHMLCMYIVKIHDDYRYSVHVWLGTSMVHVAILLFPLPRLLS